KLLAAPATALGAGWHQSALNDGRPSWRQIVGPVRCRQTVTRGRGSILKPTSRNCNENIMTGSAFNTEPEHEVQERKFCLEGIKFADVPEAMVSTHMPMQED